MSSSSNAHDVIAPVVSALNVNVSNFVSVKLSWRSNYKIWKAQMLCLIKSQGLFHIIDVECPPGVDVVPQYEELVKGWILGSVSEEVLEDIWLKEVVNEPSSAPQTSDTEGSEIDERGKESQSPVANATTESQDSDGKINSNSPTESTKDDGKKEETPTARALWSKLDSIFTPPPISDKDSFRFILRTKSVRDIPELGKTERITSEMLYRLYEAAFEGCWWKAKSILKIHKGAATKAVTENGNTILHVAVEMGHNYFVEKLLEFLKDGEDIGTKNNMGQTALHTAAVVGNEYAARILIQKRKELLEVRDFCDRSPFDSAIINKKHLTAYLFKSSPDPENAFFATCGALNTKQYELARRLLEEYTEIYATYDHLILFIIVLAFPTDLGFTESFFSPSFHNVRQKTVERASLLYHTNFWDKCVDDISRVGHIYDNTCCSWLVKISMILLVPIATLYPIYQLICLLIMLLRLPFSMLYFLLWKGLAVTVPLIKNIEKKKNDYKEAKKTLRLICYQMGTKSSVYRRSIIEAVRQGAYEVVDEILYRSPDAIKCTDEEGHNVIQLAIINRSEKVFNLIRHIIEHTESSRLMIDSSKNTLVHLAGRLAPSSVLSRITGAALQLQRELLWFEEVKKLMSPFELIAENICKETPAMVFTREHQDLLMQGEDWMKTTAESSSITAALIVTVVFAAAITVPGGNKDSGTPVFQEEIAFTIFAVPNAFSLFTSMTSLLLFLSILTTRFSERDFLVSLPNRLIFGLFTLFLSTTSMIVTFGAILFLVFCDQRPWMMAPIIGFLCLPISIIVGIKLPLLVDLIKSTYVPIFGKQSYLESCRTNRKNTIFMDMDY
ncbi:putative ankyrin repeat-containing domain, PGG domain, ankyrin repeat-containing domain superfamily [Helianthus debilis subsp. tardiflorus]